MYIITMFVQVKNRNVVHVFGQNPMIFKENEDIIDFTMRAGKLGWRVSVIMQETVFPDLYFFQKEVKDMSRVIEVGA